MGQASGPNDFKQLEGPLDEDLMLAYQDGNEKAFEVLSKKFGQSTEQECDVVVVLGGDGTMLEALHAYEESTKPVYGMNFGSVGFLMNPYNADTLLEKISAASKVTIHPLKMKTQCSNGKTCEAIAFNEVSILRETRQAARLKIMVDEVVRISELVCDGILVSTPAGSTAYNLSAHGPILPLSSNLLALTPISAFRPRRWGGALLPSHLKICIEAVDDEKRPISVTADSNEFRDVVSVDIKQSKDMAKTLLFDPDHHLEERILKEQFLS